LSKISDNLLTIYYDKTGTGKRILKQEMEDETWFTAGEAKERNLIDTILETPAAKAAFDLSMFAHAPEGFRPEGSDLTEREIEKALRDAGGSKSFALQFVHDRVKPQRDVEVDEIRESAHHLLSLMEV